MSDVLSVKEVSALCAVSGLQMVVSDKHQYDQYACAIFKANVARKPMAIGTGHTEEAAIIDAWENYVDSR